ncbi:HAD family hydrolase [Nocardioides lianchengensis]|uniref:Haloacid dehalogenase-like hydrolase n=1 Tax=Nocardioides lianchengensis TaxID=1045774 RepID=A0A1G7B565_9ACTN|nr:HAD family hydrolase [Nocardioides lianchengensis]NYG10115.1 Cu+-exporting ATPase [Nocardioides lianchengensis]SDE22171.1 haloacid dehalogenase-like hydrolase [Nocardioides lianchengensis]
MNAVLLPVGIVLLAAPVALLVALLLPWWMARHVGRRLGVGTISSEAPALWPQVQTLVLDPLTSLTTGHLVVTDVQPTDPDHERNLRWFAGALAHSYDDPVGHALAKLAGRGRVTDVAQEPGRGIRGSVDRHPVRVGEPAWIGHDETLEQATVGTMVAVEVDHRPLGRITVADEVRADACRQLERLRTIGTPPVLVSPGSEEAVARVARLAASTVWHAATDPARVADDLAAGGATVGLVRTEPDGTTTLVVVTHGPAGPAPHRGAVATGNGAADTLAHAVALTLCLHRSRRRAAVVACGLVLVLLPLAVLGLLVPLVALALAALAWLGVALTAVWGFTDLQADEEEAASR